MPACSLPGMPSSSILAPTDSGPSWMQTRMHSDEEMSRASCCGTLESRRNSSFLAHEKAARQPGDCIRNWGSGRREQEMWARLELKQARRSRSRLGEGASGACAWLLALPWVVAPVWVAPPRGQTLATQERGLAGKQASQVEQNQVQSWKPAPVGGVLKEPVAACSGREGQGTTM